VEPEPDDVPKLQAKLREVQQVTGSSAVTAQPGDAGKAVP
jgi:hypothetical protein